MNFILEFVKQVCIAGLIWMVGIYIIQKISDVRDYLRNRAGASQ